MSLSLYDFVTPAMIRGLVNLSAQIDKAVAYAAEKGIAHEELLHARLAPDMYDFVQQVQRVSDVAKFAAARLSQQLPPVCPDVETTFDELKARIDTTIAYLRSVPREAIDGQENIEVRFTAGPYELSFTGADYVRSFALPNFYFHASAAYAILRHKGVPVGKLDFLGRIQ